MCIVIAAFYEEKREMLCSNRPIMSYVVPVLPAHLLASTNHVKYCPSMRNWLAYFLIDAGALDVQMRKWQGKDEGVDIGEEERREKREWKK